MVDKEELIVSIIVGINYLKERTRLYLKEVLLVEINQVDTARVQVVIFSLLSHHQILEEIEDLGSQGQVGKLNMLGKTILSELGSQSSCFLLIHQGNQVCVGLHLQKIESELFDRLREQIYIIRGHISQLNHSVRKE